MKPDPHQIMRDAARLRDEKFKQRLADLQHRADLRWRRVEPDIPEAYRDTTTAYKSPLINEEGKSLLALIYAQPVPHVTPPSPALQPQTTKMERWAMAMFTELETAYGAQWIKLTDAQVHDNCAFLYFGMKRDAYTGGPPPPGEDAPPEELAAYKSQNDRYKRDAGIASVFDYRFVPANTVLYRGDVRNPLCVYEVKDVDEDELIIQYGLKTGPDGKLTKPAVTTLPSGTAEGQTRSSRKLRVVEYWDRQWCMIVVENGTARWRGSPRSADALVLDEWEHNWGRVPYFAAPAFETASMDEETKFSGPLDGLYAEIPEYNNRRTMFSNVAYQTSYPAWQAIQKDGGELILDDTGQPKSYLKPKPGEVLQMAPGQAIADIPMQKSETLFQELLAREAWLRQFSLSPVAKGESPGADTANAALTQLHRQIRSTLSPMNASQARLWRDVLREAFKRVRGESGKGIGEMVAVYDTGAQEIIELEPEDIVTLVVDVKVAPDTGQDDLIAEAHAANLVAARLITPMEFHERRKKENPEEYVRAQVFWDMFQSLLPEIQMQIRANLGDTGAITQLIAANQETGDARSAVPAIMEQVQMRQNPHRASGIGTGSPGQPRAAGVRSPAVLTNTQPGPLGENGLG